MSKEISLEIPTSDSVLGAGCEKFQSKSFKSKESAP